MSVDFWNLVSVRSTNFLLYSLLTHSKFSSWTLLCQTWHAIPHLQNILMWIQNISKNICLSIPLVKIELLLKSIQWMCRNCVSANSRREWYNNSHIWDCAIMIFSSVSRTASLCPWASQLILESSHVTSVVFRVKILSPEQSTDCSIPV